MKYTLKNENIESYNESNTCSFPKYTSQLINWANQNAQGTRPVVVGQMSELFPEFMASGKKVTIENWHDWYVERYPDAFDKATDKIYAQVQNLRDAIPIIDREMVKHWVEISLLLRPSTVCMSKKRFWLLLLNAEEQLIALLLPKKNLLVLTAMSAMFRIL